MGTNQKVQQHEHTYLQITNMLACMIHQLQNVLYNLPITFLRHADIVIDANWHLHLQ